MAKNNSLSYIRRYLNTFENAKCSRGVNSSYHIIDDVHIRVSNHNKKVTKDYNKNDIDIVSAINNDKFYIVSVKNSLGNMILDLNGTKEFIRNYILIKKLNIYNKTEIFNGSGEKKNEEFGLTNSDKIFEVDRHAFGEFLTKKYKWYTYLTDGARKQLKMALFSKKDLTIGGLDTFLNSNLNEMVKKKIRLNKKIVTEDIMSCFKIESK